MPSLLYTLARKIQNSFRLERLYKRLPLESMHIAGWDPIGKWTSRYKAHAAGAQGNYAGVAGANYGRTVTGGEETLPLEDGCDPSQVRGCSATGQQMIRSRSSVSFAYCSGVCPEDCFGSLEGSEELACAS